MKCPYCGKDNNHVIAQDKKSHRAQIQNGVRRQRVCYCCDHRFTTIEQYAKEYKSAIKPKAFIKRVNGSKNL